MDDHPPYPPTPFPRKEGKGSIYRVLSPSVLSALEPLLPKEKGKAHMARKSLSFGRGSAPQERQGEGARIPQ